MRKSNWWICTLVVFGFILTQSACGQNLSGEANAYLNEVKNVEKATTLINNRQQLVPFIDLGELKIASIHFSFTYAAAFDSLANKYTSIQVFNGADYFASKGLGELGFDTKSFNTLIVQLTDVDLANPQILGFIDDNSKIKNVVVPFMVRVTIFLN